MALRLLVQSRSAVVASWNLGGPQNLRSWRSSALAALAPEPAHDEVTRMLSGLREEALDKLVLDLEASQDGMGALSSTPTVLPAGDTDALVAFPASSHEQFLARCQKELANLPPPLQRELRSQESSGQGELRSQESSGQGELRSQESSGQGGETIRMFSWNLLSQALGTQNDGFVLCPASALEWGTRRWRLLEELVRHRPSIICLQEVDHFPMVERALASLGYTGHFTPKPDSPCIYLPSNSGPDGCAVFYRSDEWEVVGEVHTRVLEVWHVQSNQVAVAVNLRSRRSGREVCVATTHLKARTGALLATLRHEQGKDLLAWLATVKLHRPLILTGDFNAEPTEPVVRAVTEELASAYPDTTPFTTWKVRESGEQKSTLDYIFHSKGLEVEATLDMPTEEQVGVDRLPSEAFPSDHLSLVADFRLL